MFETICVLENLAKGGPLRHFWGEGARMALIRLWLMSLKKLGHGCF